MISHSVLDTLCLEMVKFDMIHIITIDISFRCVNSQCNNVIDLYVLKTFSENSWHNHKQTVCKGMLYGIHSEAIIDKHTFPLHGCSEEK